MTTWNSTSTGRSSSSSILDENDTSGILVYKYRIGGPRLEVQSQQSLCKFLRGDPRYRLSKKPIPRGNSRVDVRMEDILTDEERSAYSDKPNRRSSLASVGLPSNVYWKRLLFNDFQDLYIVSTFSSPESTPDVSPESSQHVSPASTFQSSDRSAAAAGTAAGTAAGDNARASQEQR